MSSEWTVDAASDDTGEADGDRGFFLSGKCVAVAVSLALVVLTAAWLFLGATPARDVVVWCSVGLLTVSLLVLGAVVVRTGGRSRREAYRRAVLAASGTSGCGEGTVPSRLGGAGGSSARVISVLIAVPTLLALWAALGVTDARGSGTSTTLAEAGAVVEQLPITGIENEVAEGGNRRADATADFTVMLPSPTDGSGVPATFEASTNRRQEVGGELYVAYVPERPELGAIGDDQREDVERQLAGRAVEFGTGWLITGIWTLITLALVAGWWLTDSTRRRPRSVGPDWQALRVTVIGAGEHIDAPPPGGTSAADERKQRENTRRLKGLVLQGDGTELPFHSQMAAEAAAHALAGSHAWLLWDPRRRRGRDIQADLVGDDGWQLPGAILVTVAERTVKAGHTLPAHPDPQRRVRLLDLGAGWLTTASLPVLITWAASLGCLVALLTLPESGAWRLWTAAAGLLAPVVGLAAQEMNREDPGTS